MNKKAQELQNLEILDVIQAIASGDYSRQAEIKGDNELIDALAISINMLGEELEALNIEQVLKSKELLAKNKKLQKANSQLAIDKHKYEALKQNAPIGIFRRTAGNAAKFIEANPALFRIFGFSNKEEFLAKNPDDLWWDPSESIKHLKKLEDKSLAVENEAAMRRKNSDRIFCHVSTMAVKNKQGKVQFYDGVISDITQQKQIQDNLEYESSLIRTLLENTQDNMYFKDLKSRFRRVSRSMAEKAGFKDPLELLGKTDNDLFSNEYASQALRDEQRIIKTGAPLINVEEHEIWADGKEKWVRTSKMPWVNEKGEIIGTCGISHDITRSKRWEMELSASDEKFRRLVQNMGEGIGIVDEEEQFLFANPAAEKIFGVQPDKMVGRNIKDFIGPEERERISRETNRRKINGKNQFAETFVIFRDITEEYKLRQEIREREGFLDNITGAAKDAMVVIDHQGSVTFWNPSAEVLFGYTKEEIMGRNFHDIMVPPEYHDAYRNGFVQFLRTGKGNAIGKSLELFALLKSGNKIPVELSLSAMKVEDQWNAVGIIRDITERKISENNLKEARAQADQANHAKSEFLANISHEIRTPMNAILGFSEILENQVSADPEIRDYIMGIKNSGKGLLSLINDILDLSKIEADKLAINYRAVNPYDIINEIRQIFVLKTREKKLAFEINIDKSLPHGLILDETRLRQILFNLIGNAVKFTSSGGITVNVRSLDQVCEGSQINLVFEIIDTGIGIPAEELDHIFEPFRQTEGQNIRQYGGTGLGLTITRRLVNLMNGTIELESNVNEGSKFSVCFPGIEVAVLTDEREELHSSNINLQFQNAHILHIEDIESNRKIIRGFLKTQNIKITEAENGKTGIEKARKLKPDLILLDIQILEMDGYEVTRILKSDPALRDIPVIIITSSALKEEQEKFGNLCNGYLRKPFTGEALVNELARYLPHISTVPTLEGPAEIWENFIELEQDEIGEKGIHPELGTYFREEILPEYEAILKNKSNLRLRNFAALITETGLEYKIGCLEKYGELLSQYIKTFNVGKIDHMLLDFRGISEIFHIR
jgi:PAS domain S-box-containing protein